MNRSWFESLFGFVETSAEDVRQNLVLEGTRLRSRANERVFEAGRLEIPSLARLREQAASTEASGSTTVEEWVADARELHRDERAAGALFQVASQFNLLEMVGPEVPPERGVTGYVDDHTQGPACAIAAAAGTVYRAYFHPVGDRIGQSADRQIDCLADVEARLRRDDESMWAMRNGYALPSREQLREVRRRIEHSSASEIDALRDALRIGVQWNTAVTLPGAEGQVSQAYCSALPIAYSRLPSRDWEPFGRLVLEGAYEATLAAAVLQSARSGNRRVFLTLLGGGAFGNPGAWIIDAIERALDLYADAGLEVVLVSYGSENPAIGRLLR